MIKLKQVSKTFDTKSGNVHAVKDVNLEIQDGEIFGIIGFSGAGKSTLVRCINLLERPTQGRVLIDEVDLMDLDEKKLREVRKKIGMIFQHFNLMRSRTVYQNIEFPLKKTKLTKNEREEKIASLLELVGLTDKRDAYPSQLSGGQKQRVAIARALAMNPKILILDEPTAGLDPKGRDEILDQIAELHKVRGITIILVSHSMEDVAKLVNRIIIMKNGHIHLDKSTKEAFSDVDDLKKVGLNVPQITELMDILRKKGHHFSKNILTVDEAFNEIKRELRKN